MDEIGQAHGVEAVEDQVDHNLLQLNPVGGDRRQARRQLEVDRRPAQRDVGCGQVDHLFDDFVDVEWAARDASPWIKAASRVTLDAETLAALDRAFPPPTRRTPLAMT